MGRLDEKGLLKQLRQKEFDKLYLLYGTEDYLKKHYASLIPKKIIKPDFETFNLHMLDGNSTSLEEISDCVNAMPLMDEYSCTVVHDMNLAELAADNRFREFTEIVSDIPESSVLVFWLNTIQADEKNAKWKKILNLFDKYGSAVNLSRRSLSALAKLLSDSAAKKGCVLDRADALYMVNSVGDDMGTLQNELNKLCLYKAGDKITRADIDDTVIFSAQARIYSLADFIINRKADESFEVLGLLIKQREEPIRILAVLSGTYIDMYRVKAAVQSGLNPSTVADCFGEYKRKMFLLRNAASSSKKYSMEQLRHAIALLSKADIDLKSTQTDGKTILEFLIINLLRI